MDYSNWDFYWRISEEKVDGEWGNHFRFLDFLPVEDYSEDVYGASGSWRIRLERTDSFTALDIGKMVDSDLENGNYHSSVGFGYYLATALMQEVGPRKAREILARMVRDRGSLLVVDY